MSIYKDYYEDHVNDKDFVNVVRCKDCRWYVPSVTIEESLEYCKWRTDENPDEDDYCSCGERREE